MAISGGFWVATGERTTRIIQTVTKILDKSGTNGTGTTTYAYDNLYRLTAATATQSNADYSQTYVYDWLGNTTSGPAGNYTYPATGYSNPDAAGSIGATNYTYDAAGNATNIGSNTYTYDYRNRLTDVYNASGGATTTHSTYDAKDARVSQSIKKGSGATTTTNYFNQYYETTGATTTMYIYAGGQLLATIEGDGTATSTNVVHTDHQGGTNVVSDGTGVLKQLTTYYPFGEARQNQLPSSGFNEKRQFIGQYFDDATSLSYLNARYYSGANGIFISQDPVSRDIGTIPPTSNSPCASQLNANTPSGGASTCGTGKNGEKPGYILNANGGAAPYTQTTILSDPQMLNFYAYSRNNPITMSDPSGLLGIGLQLGFTTGVGYGDGAGTNMSYGPTLFYGSKEGFSMAATANYGSYAGKTVTDSKPGDGNARTVFGLYWGPGISLFLTTANSAKDLTGPSVDTSLSLPVAGIQYSNGSAAKSISIGLKGTGALFSTYPSNTVILNSTPSKNKQQ